MSLTSRFTSLLTKLLCSGSSRKLIAGWWYSILALSLLLTIISLWVVSTRSPAEGFACMTSSLLLVGLSVGGTMIMRKFHNSIAVGLFMGSIVAGSQLFFFLFLIYLGYSNDLKTMYNISPTVENTMAFLSLSQSILLGSFALILGAHRTEILDSRRAGGGSDGSVLSDGDSMQSIESREVSGYAPPLPTSVVKNSYLHADNSFS